MRIVVTGGAGFIGANLTRALLHAGDAVVVVDDFSTGRRGNLHGLDVMLLEGSVLDRAILDKAMVDADAVVHLAALPSVPRSIKDPVASHHANATGTLEVLEAVRRAGSPHVVVASSSSVYGANPELPKHEDMRVAPMSPYAVSKLATEAYALAFARCYGLDVLAFRFFNVFGPLQPAGHAYAAVIPAFIDAAVAGRPLPLQGDGSQSRDFTFVGSVGSVLTDAVHRRVTCEQAINLAFGGRTTLAELIAMLEQELGHAVSVDSQPPRPGDVPHSQADAGRLRAMFPDVEPVSLEEGLRATVVWFRETGHS